MSSNSSAIKSQIFNKSDADVTFKSSDGILFALHKKNLAQHTGGFPPEETCAGPEVIELSEESETLELLFQFVYPPDDPSLKGVPFTSLLKLAHAAEKYMVYIARSACRMCMLYLLQRYHYENALENLKKEDLKSIVKYAAEHSYMDIMDDVASLLVPEPLHSTIFCFTCELQATWALYREQWIVLQREASENFLNHKFYCKTCIVSTVTTITLTDLTKGGATQSHLCDVYSQLRAQTEIKIKGIQKFSSIRN
ncbi:hypothetical protein BDQ17DRAFT_1371608 [Cyathus striatus]|nr:hypothetical protein BDQ17DRAFT_1371608 [Cyathus striatus]